MVGTSSQRISLTDSPTSRSSFFLIGFYTLSLVCFSLIVKFGILHSVNAPGKTLRGMFVLSSFVAGVAGGGFAIFFWQATKYFIGAWGGLAFGLWVQCFRDGGLIRPVGVRWVMFIGMRFRFLCQGVISRPVDSLFRNRFRNVYNTQDSLPSSSCGNSHRRCQCSHFGGGLFFHRGAQRGKARYSFHSCHTNSDLSIQFYVWNIGFRDMFPKYIDHNIEFPVTQSMQIEIGLIGAIWLMGIAVQLRILKFLQEKLREIKAEQRRRERQDEAKSAERFSRLEQEKALWEREHPSLIKHDRTDSEFSGTTLLKGGKRSSSPRAEDSNFGSRPRRSSGLSEFLVAGTPEEELKRVVMKNPQAPGALPVLDLGSDIKDDVPRAFVSGDAGKVDISSAKPGDLKAREELLQEIQTIRRSIEVLKSETPQPSSGSSSRQPSLASRARTLSYDFNSTVLSPSHQRPPRQPDPRARIHSMDLPSLDSHIGHSIGRPTSAPLRDEDWDSYLRNRTLLQPPSGVSAPIATTPMPVVVPTPRVPVPAAVQDALLRRQMREILVETGVIPGDKVDTPTHTTSHDVSTSASKSHHRRAASSHISGSYMPPTILPPRKATPPPAQHPRTVTYEELTERHREKLRELQAPLTNAEKEQAELEAAKARWDRSKAAERHAVPKRQAERAAAVQAKESRRRRSEDTTRERNNTNRQPSAPRDSAVRHSRSKSADKLNAIPSPAARAPSARLSMLKVEDWQRYQAEQGQSPSTPTRRDSGVPFPDSKGHENRPNRRMSGLPRDPPN